MSGASFAFVLSTPEGKVGQSEKLRVRSHCMKGKNKRLNSRRSLQHARRAKKTEDVEEAHRQRPPNEQASSVSDALLRPNPDTILLVPFASDLSKESRQTLHQFLQYARLKHEFYATDYIVNFDKYMTDYIPWLFKDGAFFHSVLMSTSATQDFLRRRPFSSTTLHHLRETLALLNQRLSNGDMYRTDSTIWIILTLAMTAGFFLDFASTGTHIAGLRQIVHLSGGRKFLEARPKIQHKLESLDFSFCLSCGAAPRLWGPPVAWEPIFAEPSTAPIHLPSALRTNERLLDVFNDLREFAVVINTHVAIKKRLDGQFFQKVMSSVRYRLLFLLKEREVQRSPECECLCLGMLAFLTTMFAIPGRRLLYPHLAERVRSADWGKAISKADDDDFICMWMLLVCAMTVVDMSASDEEWLKRLWVRASKSSDMTWETLREKMFEIAWFSNIHDAAGRETFVSLNNRHHAYDT